MKFIVSVLALGALVSCGAAGDPLRPTTNLGLSIGSDGRVTPSASVSTQAGPVSINVGL